MVARYLLLCAVLFAHQCCLGQTFPKDDAGRVTYYDVVNVDSMPKALLFQNGKAWFHQIHLTTVDVKMTLLDSLNGKLSAETTLSVYTGSGVLKKLAGKFRYTSSLEVKDNRYRYVLTDFVFHEYKADRYHAILPTGKTKSIEEDKAAGWQKMWDKHRNTLDQTMTALVSKLRTKMLERPKATSPTAPEKKDVRWED